MTTMTDATAAPAPVMVSAVVPPPTTTSAADASLEYVASSSRSASPVAVALPVAAVQK